MSDREKTDKKNTGSKVLFALILLGGILGGIVTQWGIIAPVLKDWKGAFGRTLTESGGRDHHHEHDGGEDSGHHHEHDGGEDHDHHHEHDGDEDHGHHSEHDGDEDHDHHSEHDGDDDHGHHHGEKPIDEIVLSQSAAKNFGIDDSVLRVIELQDYSRTFEIPAVLEEVPGHTNIQIPAPATGIITRIYPESGTAVAPKEPLFEIQLNHPDLITAQNDYLLLQKALQINQQEQQRLQGLDAGIVPQKQREVLFERERLESEIAGKKGMLELLGLTREEIEHSLDNGEIVKQITVFAPDFAESESDEPLATFEKLSVDVGQQVTQGDSLGQLCRMNRLMVKGKLFAGDEKAAIEAIQDRKPVTVYFDNREMKNRASSEREAVGGLTLRSMENEVNSEGVVFCYAELVNERKISESGNDSGGKARRFIQWRHRPGERCTLAIEYEKMPGVIVLPAAALAHDLGEAIVFEKTGTEEDKMIWKKRAVTVLDQTKDFAVLSNDGSVPLGAPVAGWGADFLLSALSASEHKAAGGGGIQHGDHVH